MFFERSFKRAYRVAGLMLAMTGGVWSLPVEAAERFKCRASAQVLDEALNAYARSDYTGARKRFECLIAEGDGTQKFYASFYLARILSDTNGHETDHDKAYTVYTDFFMQNQGVDTDDPRKAPFVAKALTAIGMYALRGSPEAGVKRSPQKAAELFRQSASTFDEPDSQFELAKLLLVGEGVKPDPDLALHYLQKLTQESHAGAQAFLSDLMWRGKHVPRQQVQAYALIQLALENATPADRLWIEDTYQNIYCGLGEGVRQQSTGLVGNWRRQFLKPLTTDPLVPVPQDAELSPVRTCANGDRVIFPHSRLGGPSSGDTAKLPDAVRPAGSQSLGMEPNRR
ncbi:MAG: tetratricopeptide repeat protein [Hyphomicrobiaceae bacterium]|nr:sel1 repeat family protein [Hyphomicrobiaceae bacterium]